MSMIFVSDAEEFGTSKDIVFTARVDHSEQRYIEMLPHDFDENKSYDLIIGLHGHGADRWQFAEDKRDECRAFRNFAVKHRMIAITPDYRAKTSWMGPKAESDMVQIIGDLKKKYKIRYLFLTGGSMGGASALTFAVLHPEMLDGVTSMNGLANHLEYKNFQDAIAESFGETNSGIQQEKKRRSAEFYPEQLTMPIAFTIGGKDVSVPPDSVLRLVDKLKKSKVLLIHRPETGHTTSFADAMEALEFMYDSVTSTTASNQNKEVPLLKCRGQILPQISNSAKVKVVPD